MITKKRFITGSLLGVALAVAATLLIENRLQHRKFETTPDIQSGPWGEMQVWDIHLEQPVEYVSFDRTGSSGPYWHFGMLQSQAVKGVLSEAGCNAEEISGLLAGQVPQKDGSFVICPPEKVLLSLNPEVRSKLYLTLAGDIGYTKNGVNLGQPWVLMHEKDMVAHFSALERVRIAYMRPRDY